MHRQVPGDEPVLSDMRRATAQDQTAVECQVRSNFPIYNNNNNNTAPTIRILISRD